MKRFYVTAAIAASLLATGCQKTYVIDEVRTPIGFSTEVGKQTKTIVNGTGFTAGTHTFGVLAYALTGSKDWNADNYKLDNVVMNNVEVKGTAASAPNPEKWATDDKYYWPNDEGTKLSFFAYYPYQASAEDPADPTKKTLGQIPGVDANGITLTGYVHDNIYVDFMTAKAENKTYLNTTGGQVPLGFKHHLTKIDFDITTDMTDITTINLKSITLKKIVNKANFDNGKFSNSSEDSDKQDYIVYNSTETNGTTLSTANDAIAPCTVLPQEFVESGQFIEVIYYISGSNVATETVTKKMDLKNLVTGHVQWTAGQSVTYKMKIGLNEITFAPTVVDWTSGDIQVPAN